METGRENLIANPRLGLGTRGEGERQGGDSYFWSFSLWEEQKGLLLLPEREQPLSFLSAAAEQSDCSGRGENQLQHHFFGKRSPFLGSYSAGEGWVLQITLPASRWIFFFRRERIGEPEFCSASNPTSSREKAYFLSFTSPCD